MRESEELALIHHAAQFLTNLRHGAEEQHQTVVTMTHTQLTIIEQQMWSAYTLACEAEAIRDSQETKPATA